MKSRILPGFCTSGADLEPAGIVVHYMSGRNVDPERQFELDACRELLVDLNRAKHERRCYMLERKWPDRRMYASAHLLVGLDGTTWKLVEFDKQAYHAGRSILNGRANCNQWTLGIELVGTINSGFTRAQYTALAELVVELSERYGFPRSAIAGHDEVRWAAIQDAEARGEPPPKPKYDPSGRKDGQGDNFDWWYLGKLCNDIRPDPDGTLGLEQLDDVVAASSMTEEGVVDDTLTRGGKRESGKKDPAEAGSK